MTKTVLTVDDSRMGRLMVQRTLAELRPDWNIEGACEATEALEKVANFDLMFVDVNMPGMDGLELTSLLRVDFPTTPIALVTANVQANVREHGQTLGLGVIGKPITRDKLEEWLDAVNA